MTHPGTVVPPGSGENRRAIEVTLAELERMGRLEAIDAARVQILRSLADAVDAKPQSPQMWREYRDGLEELIAGGDPEDLPDLLAELRADGGDAEA